MGLRRGAGLLLWAHPALRQGPAMGAGNLSLLVFFRLRLRIEPRALAMYRCRGAWVWPTAALPAVSAGAGAAAAGCLVGLSPDLAKTLALVATVFAVFGTLHMLTISPSNKLSLLLLQQVVSFLMSVVKRLV